MFYVIDGNDRLVGNGKTAEAAASDARMDDTDEDVHIIEGTMYKATMKISRKVKLTKVKED